MDLLATLESSGFSTWLRESNSIWGYPMILTLHTVGLALVVAIYRSLGRSDVDDVSVLHG